MLIRNLFFFFIFLFFFCGLRSQEIKELFQSDSLLQIHIEFDREEVITDIEEGRPVQRIYGIQKMTGAKYHTRLESKYVEIQGPIKNSVPFPIAIKI